MRARSATGLRRIAWVAACIVTGCQSPHPVDVPQTRVMNGIGYVILNAPISVSSRDLLMSDVENLRSAGATEIHLGINSPGGDIDAAQAIVDYMARVHSQNGVVFKAYNIGLVASAATFVFLNAQDRYSVANGAFLFHAAGVVSNGPISAPVLREQADKLDAYERTIRATMKARTHLTESEAQTYVRRTVVLNSDDARRDGIVDAIAPYAVPAGVSGWVIVAKPNAATRTATPANPPSG